jgi:hypothetical protein
MFGTTQGGKTVGRGTKRRIGLRQSELTAAACSKERDRVWKYPLVHGCSVVCRKRALSVVWRWELFVRAKLSVELFHRFLLTAHRASCLHFNKDENEDVAKPMRLVLFAHHATDATVQRCGA